MQPAEAPYMDQSTAQAFPQLSFEIDNPNAPYTIYISTNPAVNQLTFVITTNTNGTGFTPGTPVPPDQGPAGTGSLLYLNLTNLGLSQTEFSQLTFTADGWTSQSYPSQQTVCLTPTKATTIDAGASILVAVGNFSIANPPSGGSVQLVTTYYRVDNITFGNIGVPTTFKELLVVPPDGKADLHEAIQLTVPQFYLVTSSGQYPSVANSLSMVFQPGPAPRQIIATKDTAFIVTFVYANSAPGYGALTTPQRATGIKVQAGINAGSWTITAGTDQQNPSWMLQPPEGKPILGHGTASTVQFLLGNIISSFQPGPTLMFVSYSGVTGFQDGSYAVVLDKVPHVEIESFTATPNPAKLTNGAAQVTLNWSVTNAGTLLLMPLYQDVTGLTSWQTEITQTTQFTLSAQGLQLANQGNIATSNVNAVVLPGINSFNARPSAINNIDFPSNVTLSWNVNSNQPVTLSSSTTGPDPNQYQPVGTVTKQVNGPQMFTLTPLGAPPDVTIDQSVIVPAYAISASSQPLASAGQFVASPPNAAFVAVSNKAQNQVSILSTITYQDMTPAIPVGTSPAGLSFSPDGSLLFVANSGNGTVSVIQVTPTGSVPPYSFQAQTPLKVGGNPQQVISSPDGKYLYVTIDNGTQPGSLAILENKGSGMFTPVTTITVGLAPRGVAALPSNAQVFVANSASNTVSVIGVGAGGKFSLVNTIPNVEQQPTGLAVTVDGSLLLAACSGSNQVFGINTALPLSARKLFTVGKGPQQIAVAPTGDYAFVTNQGDASVSVLSVSKGTVIGSAVQVAASPNGIAASADGGLVFVASGSSSTLSVLTLAEYQDAGPQPCAGAVTDSAVSPDASAVVSWFNNLLKLPQAPPPSTGVNVLSLASSTTAQQMQGENLIAFLFSPVVSDQAAYVTQVGTSTISVVNTQTYQPVASITIPPKSGLNARRPTRMATTSDGKLLFVMVSDGNNQFSLVVYQANVTNRSFVLTTDIVLFKTSANGLYFFTAAPDGSSVFAVDSVDGQMTVATSQGAGVYGVSGPQVPIGAQAFAMAISPSGDELSVLNKAGLNNAITKVDTKTLKTTTVFLTGNVLAVSLNALAYSPDGQKLLASDGIQAGVRVLDAESLRLVQTIPQNAQMPFGISVMPDGSRIFTANTNSTNLSVLQQVQPA